MDININITLGATPALMAALTALTNAVTQVTQVTPATPAVPAMPAAPVVAAEQKPAAKPAKKGEPKPAAPKKEEKAEGKKEEPKPAEEPGKMSYETFVVIIREITKKVGPDRMRELIKQFGGERVLRTVPKERWLEFIDAAKALEGGAA